MYVVRPAKTEVDVWAELMAGDGGDATAASRWNWDNLYKYMMKAEFFTPPTKSVLGVVDIKYNQSTYGNSGPLQISYPAVYVFFFELLGLSRPLIMVFRMINISSTWTQSCATAGVPELTSPNGGVTLGSFIAPSTMNPSNLTRSYARSAYIDSLAPRPNLHILTEYTVLKINFAPQTDPAGNKIAKNVEFGKSRGLSSKTVDIKKELVLAAGALSSPKILLMSGVGPKDVLEGVGIKVEVPLPGVGQRLQDHMVSYFPFRADWLY
jgi:choline dehydrogenase